MQSYKHRYTRTERHIKTHSYTERHIHTHKHTHKHTQTDRHTHKHTHKHTHRQRQIHRHRQTHRLIHTYKHNLTMNNELRNNEDVQITCRECIDLKLLESIAERLRLPWLNLHLDLFSWFPKHSWCFALLWFFIFLCMQLSFINCSITLSRSHIEICFIVTVCLTVDSYKLYRHSLQTVGSYKLYLCVCVCLSVPLLWLISRPGRLLIKLGEMLILRSDLL